MVPKIKSGQLVTVRPVYLGEQLSPGMIVLCTVKGKHYLHKIVGFDGLKAIIGNNKGHINGTASKLHGILESVAD